MIASAVLFALAFPPANLGLLTLVAFVPWLNYLRTLNGKEAWWSGVGFGILFYLFQMAWIIPFVGRWSSPALALIPWLVSPVIACWYFGIVALAIQRSFQMGWTWLIPLAWAGIEVLRSYFPLIAFPWGLAATSLWYVRQVIQPAAVGTIFLVSAWVLLVNLVIANLLKPKARDQQKGLDRSTGRMGIVALGIMALSLFRSTQAPPGEVVKIGIGQPGVDLAFQSLDKQEQALAEELPWLGDQAKDKGCRLLVLPEGLTSAGDDLPPPTPFAGDPPLPVLLGGQRGRHPSYQSAFSYSEGKWDYADKTRLVIFGEFVPFRKALSFLDGFKLPSGDLEPGSRVKAVDVADIRVGPLLCFEALFPNVAQAQVDNGSRLLAVMSNDDWYLDSNAPEQLKAGSVFRAVESGLPLVRAASQGYTMAVDSRGRVLSEAPLRSKTLLVAEIAIPTQSDAFPYRWIFPWIAVAGLTAALVGPFMRRKA